MAAVRVDAAYTLVSDAVGERVLLVRNPDTWSLLGGRREDGESLLEAAVRETREEASVVVHVGERIDVELHDGFTVFRAELLSVRRRPAAATRTSPRWAGCPWRVPAS